MGSCIVIGGGFAGMSAACYLAKAGWQVTILEKHSMPGGRARQFKKEGFVFDMGPSWYWMPGVFEKFFNDFGYKVSDFYHLQRLDPSYRVFWDEAVDIPADYNAIRHLFNSFEPGSANQLDRFLKGAEYKYEVGINKLVRKPGRSWSEFLDMDLAKGIVQLDVFTSMSKHIRRYFKDPRLIQLLEFPVLFLGALPRRIPALYSLMNYADLRLGTWYPQGGMFEIVKAMKKVATGLGVKFVFNSEVSSINIASGTAKSVSAKVNGEEQNFECDIVIGGADYHHIETSLLSTTYRSYDDNYWKNRVMAPSCQLYFIGLNRKVEGLRHHNLFFDTDFEVHGRAIYENPSWPDEPLFYVCAPSVTDASVAPAGSENLFFLVPVASGLEDTEEERKKVFDKILTRFEKAYGGIRENIVVKEEFGVRDFIRDYNAFRGNAYGLANTIMQTAIMKPSIKSRKVKNLFYTGQLTVPGPGVPPSLISGEVTAGEVNKLFGSIKRPSYDTAF